MPTPTVPGWGFFMRAASRTVWDSPSSLPSGGRGGEGEASRGSSRSVASLYPLLHLTRDVSHVYWGSRQRAGAPVHAGVVARVASRSWVYGPRDLPVRLSVSHTSPQCGVCHWCFPYAPLLCGCSVRRKAWPDRPPAAADQPTTVWQCAHARQALRSISRQEGSEEHDFCDCGTLH